ncbi:MAG: class I SAM-dependent methyltransferase [Planctomycetaceae bacterium]
MRPAEYQVMADVEDSHWWYVAQRLAMQSVIERSGLLKTLNRCSVLDAGCGTGGNLKWLKSLLEPRMLAGFDRSSEAVEAAEMKVPAAKVWRDDVTCLSAQLQPDSFDLILCSDVIYSLDQSVVGASLRSLLTSLRSGGVFLLHVPALSWLYSQHDVSVGTQHRYGKSEVKSLLKALGLDLVFLSYRVSVLFPLVVLLRLPSMLSVQWQRFRGTERTVHREQERPSEMRKPAALVNSVLTRVMAVEARWFRSGRTFPIGSSLVALGRKP